ncbi:hypothetical protein FOWG_12093 [Fusarium oxysporum f. sp. lycopersici MN25]|nr:hypothetical protein FOWG_12093 [Fusarium oxysporum f. sp. lycopersici MN25]
MSIRKSLQAVHLQWVIVAAALFETVAAIPCSEIGWSTGRTGDGPAGLDPFDPQGRWEVVRAKDYWVRFQSYRPGQNPIDVRVTKTEFKATPEHVRGTINNYNNEGKTNIMLRLPLATKSFQYAKVVDGNLGEDFEVIELQSSIDKDRTILSIILPSGKRKLEEVRPASADQGGSSINFQRAEAVGITGLKGTISPDDWAYTTIVEAQLVMLSIYQEQEDAYFDRRHPNLRNAWITAEKADPNECVVIDFRDFVDFFLRPRPAAVS